MCVLSIKVPIRKKSGNLFNDPGIYIYIYIYIGFDYFPRLLLPKFHVLKRKVIIFQKGNVQKYE